ncbi:hypothetical protein AB9F29_17765 [Falsihalocynthiibacter sp. S25ZX9]
MTVPTARVDDSKGGRRTFAALRMDDGSAGQSGLFQLRRDISL